MNVMVPISKIDQIDKYCQAGADEFYFGFYDEKWDRKYGIFEEMVLVNNCVGDFVWRFMQSLESLYL